jgi:hypothetical protein
VGCTRGNCLRGGSGAFVVGKVRCVGNDLGSLAMMMLRLERHEPDCGRGCSNIEVVKFACRARNFLRDPIGRDGRAQAPCMPRGSEPCPADTPPRGRHRPTAPVINFLARCRSVISSLRLCELAIPSFVFVVLAMSSTPSPEIPTSILIVGSGAFGLSTAWALCRNPQYKDTTITVVDRQPFPTPDGSSVSS